MNEGVILHGGYSLLSSNQIIDFGHHVHDVPIKYGGLQNLETVDVYTLPFDYHHGLSKIQLRHPTRTELSSLPIVDLTSVILWEPQDESEDYKAVQLNTCATQDNNPADFSAFSDTGILDCNWYD